MASAVGNAGSEFMLLNALFFGSDCSSREARSVPEVVDRRRNEAGAV